MTQPTGRTIELRGDIPCTGCGYNLRGLAPQGRCPECGQDVSVSLAEHVVPEATVAALDPWWRRQMIEAVIFALLGLACAIASGFDWPQGWEWSRTGPNVPLVLTSA